jgi:hypothetical protein
MEFWRDTDQADFAEGKRSNSAISGTKKETAESPQAMAAAVGCVSVDF